LVVILDRGATRHQGPRENGFRPAVDPLFRSPARVYGHAWSIASLLAAIGDGIEDSLWTAIRSLEEGQLLMYRWRIMCERTMTRRRPTGSSNAPTRRSRSGRGLRRLTMAREPLPVDTVSERRGLFDL